MIWRIAELYLYSLWRAVKIIESPFHRGNAEKHGVRRSYVAGNRGMKNETRRGEKGTSDHVYGRRKRRKIARS